MNIFDKIKIPIWLGVGMITSIYRKDFVSIGDWGVIGALVFGGVGLFLSIRKDIRDAANDREEKEEELLNKIDKRFEISEQRFRESLGELKATQSAMLKKVEGIDRRLVNLSTEVQIHKESPGHVGTSQSLSELKEMLGELREAIARKG